MMAKLEHLQTFTPNMANIKNRLVKLESRISTATYVNEWTEEDKAELVYLESIPSDCPNCPDCPNPNECLAIDKQLKDLQLLGC